MADIPGDLIKAIQDGRALIVCGAGVSRLATGGAAPGWAELINRGLEAARPKIGNEPAWVRSCRELLKPDASADDWLEAADKIQERLGGHGGGPYRAFLNATVGRLIATSPPLFDSLRAIGELKALGGSRNRIATTNYDDLLREGLKWDRVTWTDADSAAECLKGDHQAVLHLHGHWREPASVVFSKRDYERLRSADRAQFIQQLAAHNFVLVFVGCSTSGLADQNVGELLDWFGGRWAGLGKTHFVLTREEEVSAGWPDTVTAIAYGKDYPELAGFLGALASPTPAATSTPASTSMSTPASTPGGAAAVAKPERAPFPPDPKMIGRRDQLEEVVGLILTGDRPIIVPGGPGMGKTTLALAATYDKRVRDKFGKARVFVNLEPTTSAEAVLRSLAAALGLDITGSVASTLELLAAHADKEPTLTILDNLETPWHAEPLKTEEMLGQLAGINGLRLVLTVRGETPMVPGGANRLGDVERLEPNDAKALFSRIAGKQFNADPALPDLLTSLDGHPLSIVLMAAQTDGRRDLTELAEEWQTRRTAMLRRGLGNDRLTSVRVSLDLSLDRLKDRPDAKRLLGLVALLPAGLQEEDIAAVLPKAGPTAARALERARLVEIRDGRLTMLAPLRETAREERLSSEGDEERMIAHFFAIASLADQIDSDAWTQFRKRVALEAPNLDAICLVALRQSAAGKGPGLEPLEIALRQLAELHRFGLPVEVSSLQQMRSLSTPSLARLKAVCNLKLGDIAHQRSDRATARTLYEEAIPLFRRIGDVREEANCIAGLGDVALDESELDIAHKHFSKARSLFKRAGDPDGEANCVMSLGDLALDQSDYTSAQKYYMKAHALFESVDSLLGQANCLNGLGDIALERAKLKEARERYEAALFLFERLKEPMGQANSMQGLGDIAMRCSKIDKARANYEVALELFEQIPDPYSIGHAHLRLLQIAASSADQDRHAAAARQAWTSIEREDLVAEYLDA